MLIRLFKFSIVIFLTIFTLLLVFMGWVKIKSLTGDKLEVPLAIRWEGFYHDMNYRDLGESINQCYGENIFKAGIYSRSAGWFSGWSCNKIGNPDVIFSLNYSPLKKEKFFCHEDSNKIIGKSFDQKFVLNDLEFINNWDNSEIRLPTCRYLENSLISIISNQKVLMHCDAGRDRSGTMSALTIALIAEKKGILNEKMKMAIECDYRKTESLVPDKFGRMKNFIDEIQKTGSISDFVNDKCNISNEIIESASNVFLF